MYTIFLLNKNPTVLIWDENITKNQHFFEILPYFIKIILPTRYLSM